MRFKSLFLVLFLASLALTACAPAGNPFALAGSTWRLVSYGPVSAQVPAVDSAKTSLTFDEQRRLRGYMGCNTFGSDVKLEGNKMIFGVMVSTMMACPGQVMEQEQVVIQVLTKQATFQLDGGNLKITSQDGKNAIVLSQAGK